MATPATLASQVLANFRRRMIKSFAVLFSSYENEQDGRTAGQCVYVSSGPGAPTGNLGTNIRGVYLREDASDTDAFIYFTIDGSTWVAVETLADLDHLIPGASTELTIATGAITCTGLLHTVDTEGDAASDDLDTISGLADGELCLLYLENAARNVVVKHGTDNISGPRGQDVTLDAAGDMVLVERKGSTIYVIGYRLAAGLPTSATAPGSTDSAAETITDHPATTCTGAAVADHGASTSTAPSADDTASATTGITAAGAATGAEGTGATSTPSADDTASATTGITAAGAATGAEGTGATGTPSADDTASATTGISTNADGTGATGTPSADNTGDATLGSLLPMPAPGSWAVDGDGAETNGGGIIGHAIVLTETATLETLVFDTGTGEYETIETAGATWRTANYAVLPDAPANGDAFMVMFDKPFPEAAFDMSATLATYTGVAGKWQVGDGASGWTDVTTIYDNTNGAAHTGSQPLARDGALVMVPEATWGEDTYAVQAGYWLRFLVTDATKITQVGQLNNKRAEIVTAEQGWAPPDSLSIISAYFADFAVNLHSATDITLLLWDQASGESRTATFKQDKRQEIAALSAPWDVTTAARIVTLIAVEDGTNEPLSALAGVYCTGTHKHAPGSHTHTGPSHTHGITDGGHTHGPGNHTHTGPSHTHTAGAISVTDGGHTHGPGNHTHTGPSHAHTAGAISVTDGGHTHGPGNHTHDTTPPAHVVTQPDTPVLAHAGMGHTHPHATTHTHQA